jgi:hypothetical protein
MKPTLTIFTALLLVPPAWKGRPTTSAATPANSAQHIAETDAQANVSGGATKPEAKQIKPRKMFFPSKTIP